MRTSQLQLLQPIRRRVRPRGFIYVLVLSVALMLATIGFSVLTVWRVRMRSAVGANDWREAGILAQSAVEYALAVIDQTPSWRTTFQNRTPMPTISKALGRGTMSAILVDEIDSNLGNYSADPVRVYGIGRVGQATRVHSVEICPDKGLPILKSAAHTGSMVYILSGREVMLSGGPISSNDRFRNEGYVYGDAESRSFEYVNIVTGKETTLSSNKAMPGTRPIDILKSRATTIPYSGNVNKQVLGPAHNFWGTPNKEGLYYLDSGGQDIKISSLRLWGTLIIRTGAGKVVIDDPVLLESYRKDYPTLIVEGNLTLATQSATIALSETAAARNFNPPGMPYGGQSDSDNSDTYPNEIRGLVHVTGEVRLEQTAVVRGMLLAVGMITVEGTPQLICDRSLFENPPLGYGDPTSPPAHVPRSWRWDTVP